MKTKKSKSKFKVYYQDGAEFYDAETNSIIASYPEYVDDDFDVAGGIAAEERFLNDHPQYKQSTVFNNNGGA